MTQVTRHWKKLAAVVALLAGVLPVHADIIVPGADGSDGIFQPQANITIDLSEAATAAWDSPSPVAGKGVYDAEKWAVVFKYESVDIPAGVVVTFANHPSGAPVVWLVSGVVMVSGSVNLNGMTGHIVGDRRLIERVPGGFAGGIGDFPTGGGFGPGGGYYLMSYSAGRSGQYSAYPPSQPYDRTYGNARIVPLIGGSGGGGSAPGNFFSAGGGGGGGGALLIATEQEITINGSITSNGGVGTGGVQGGSGSGGAIRIVADGVNGSGRLEAGPQSVPGRIRLDANRISFAHIGVPAYTAGFPGDVAELWPAEDSPRIRLVSLGGLPIPVDPVSNMVDFSQADVQLATEETALLVLETTNVSDSASVTVRLTPRLGANDDHPATYISTDGNGVSTWQVELPLSQGFSALQARVITP